MKRILQTVKSFIVRLNPLPIAASLSETVLSLLSNPVTFFVGFALSGISCFTLGFYFIFGTGVALIVLGVIFMALSLFILRGMPEQ